MKRHGPIDGIIYGFAQCYRIVELTGKALWKTVNGTIDIKKSLGGPIFIAQISGETFRAGLLPFFSLIAFISINLAIINLFPIPVLDGGYLLLFLIEGITGRPIEGRPREIAQQIGLFILIMLMLFAFYNDITRILKG
jgi:regulator of sigma E protease